MRATPSTSSSHNLRTMYVYLGSSIRWNSSASHSQLFSRDVFLPVMENDYFGRTLDEYPPIRTIEKIHSQIISRHLHSDASLSIKLMRAYAACGRPSATRHIFDESVHRNVVFFNVMIRSYVNNELYQDALLIFKNMGRHGTKPDHYTYPCALKACSGLEHLWIGLQIHNAVIRVGLDSNLFVGNALVFMYAKNSHLSGAQRFFSEMPAKDIVTWNSMIAGFAQNGMFNEALDLCKEMESKEQDPDAGTMASLLPAVTNTEPANVSFARKMFEKMSRKGLISWNAMIAIYVNNGMADEAVELYSQMEAQGVEPDPVTLSSVLPACGDLSALAQGKRIHEYIKRKKFSMNLFLDNALVDMYAKCGCLEDAREVFDQMHGRDVVSWTSMISAYGMHGKGQEAVCLFHMMRESGLKPDHIAFVSILSACSHSGLLSDGQFYFNCMIEEYKIVPTIEHFACMVDLLGRAGQVEEAYEFIKQMPLEPNERVWGALLGACRVYSNESIVLAAADRLFKLVPEQAGYYVLLSNIYAKAGRWDAVTSVRSIMKRRGIKKLPGCSNVELGNRVYTFLVGDRSHPQSNEIYSKLDFLVGKMKELGYVPETDSALHDVEEEEKECHLAVHSEKLAIAFLLINTAPGTPIRITKNLRVCSDCHRAAKLIAKITQREIILRDTNRFHHFENGLCSCGDYW
ncbi:putative pentatricopeptide repeat-containing protein At3g49142 [Aristolochia californica]|uniref:putative pentatricopeptide repeat-containing protein At3g49142 n=1 Tax=Aristolochia californica TaxID=171875 RepID=UPI0035DEDB8F